jgi:hypothetical protein
MWPRRIAVAVLLLWSALCLAIAAVLFVNLPATEPPERYVVLLLGLAMLYMGGALLAGLIWPSKPKDADAPIETPPLDQVRGRISYRDGSAMARNVMLAVGAIFLAVSLAVADKQPIMLGIAVVAAGILAGAGVMIWRQIQYGRARLELEAPARRGDTMHGVITTSGLAWTGTGRDFDATVALLALQTFRAGRQSNSPVVARASATTSVVRNGNDMTVRFTTTIPVIDISEGRFSWNVQLETTSPGYRATFLIDVA